MRLLVLLAGGPLLAAALSGPASAQPATPPSAPPTDSPQVVQEYQWAFDAMGHGDYVGAERAFDDVAARSVDPQRRQMAVQMAAQARQHEAPGAGAPPSQPPIAQPPPPPPGAAGAPAPPPLPPPAPGVAPGAAPSVAPGAAPGAALDQSGRSDLLWSSTILGLAVWAPSTAIVFNVHDGRVVTGIEMMGGGLGFVVPLALTQGEPVTRGMAHLGVGGAWLGYYTGAALDLLVQGDAVSGRSLVGAGLGASLAAGVGGVLYAHATGMSEGMADMITSGATIGTLYGLGGSVLAQFDHATQAPRLFAGSALAGMVAGGLAGAALQEKRHYSAGDVSVLDLSVGLGVAAATPPMAFADVRSRDGVIGLLMAGGVLGGVLGDHFLQGESLDLSQASIIGTGTLAGGVFGLGLAFIATPHGTTGQHLAELYSTSIVASAILGTAIAWHAVVRDAAAAAQPQGAQSVSLNVAPYFGDRGQPGLAFGGTF